MTHRLSRVATLKPASLRVFARRIGVFLAQIGQHDVLAHYPAAHRLAD